MYIPCISLVHHKYITCMSDAEYCILSGGQEGRRRADPIAACEAHGGLHAASGKLLVVGDGANKRTKSGRTDATMIKVPLGNCPPYLITFFQIVLIDSFLKVLLNNPFETVGKQCL